MPLGIYEYESAMLRSFLAGLAVTSLAIGAGVAPVGIGLGVCIWILGWPIHIASNSFQAWMRGEDPYEGAEHEEGADGVMQ